MSAPLDLKEFDLLPPGNSVLFVKHSHRTFGVGQIRLQLFHIFQDLVHWWLKTFLKLEHMNDIMHTGEVGG